MDIYLLEIKSTDIPIPMTIIFSVVMAVIGFVIGALRNHNKKIENKLDKTEYNFGKTEIEKNQDKFERSIKESLKDKVDRELYLKDINGIYEKLNKHDEMADAINRIELNIVENKSEVNHIKDTVDSINTTLKEITKTNIKYERED